MKRAYFGTDGVRGPFGGPLINEAFASRLAEAAARWLVGQGWTQPSVLLGRDTRQSGTALERALVQGLRAGGAHVVRVGIAPTPAVAAAVVREACALGIMVTASHNPAEDNGIKFFNHLGMKLTDAEELAIEALLPAEPAAMAVDASVENRAVDAYIDTTTRLLSPHALRGWRIVLDTAHGATCTTSPQVLAALGADLIQIGAAPDGLNINHGCGSEHPEGLAARVMAEGARLGIAHDGDGDRCVLCDEQGGVLDGDEILAILGLAALRQGRLAANTLVVTEQSNLGLDEAVRKAGGQTLRTQVGDRYVLEGMRRIGATLGGESSGHIVALDVTTTGDGLVAALKVLAVMLETGRPLSELRQVLRKFPQASRALRVREKRDLGSLPTLTSAIEHWRQQLGASGRVMVRYSGTESKLRLLVEGPDDERVSTCMIQLEGAVRADLEVL